MRELCVTTSGLVHKYKINLQPRRITRIIFRGQWQKELKLKITDNTTLTGNIHFNALIWKFCCYQ